MHITGGGFPENIPRIVPKGKDLGFRIQKSAWSVPPLFQWLQEVLRLPSNSLSMRFSCSPHRLPVNFPEKLSKFGMSFSGAVGSRMSEILTQRLLLCRAIAYPKPYRMLRSNMGD